MPMIIKNNVRYCSTGGDAENIVYDNAESGMEATNMQDAIDELNSNLDEQNKNTIIYNAEDDYLYINGVKWKKADLLNKYLFKNGEINSETGNFYCYESGNENGVKSGGGSVEATRLYCYTNTPNSYLRMGTNNAIDISEYSKLYVEYQVVTHVNSAYDSVHVCLGRSKEGGDIISKTVSSEIGTYTAEIDLTNITADVAYFMIYTNYVGKIYVYKIWFEK